MKLARFFLPRMEYVLLAALFWSISASGPKLLNFDGDLPRHLLVGEMIRQMRQVPLTDTFSFRTEGMPAIPHEWLSQVILSLVYDWMGLSGVVLLSALLVTIAWAIVYSQASRRSNHLFITLLVSGIGIAASMIHVLPRPHLFTYVLTVLWIGVLEQLNHEKPNRWWLLPLLMLLWVNLHGMFVLGIIIWGIYLIGSFLENPSQAWAANPTTKAMLLGGILSIIATFFSPSGSHIWESIISLGSNAYITSRIPEYQSADFHMPATWPFILLLTLAIIGLARNTIKVSWSHMLLLTSFAVLAIYTSRMIPVFALLAVPIVTKSLSDWLDQDYRDSRFIALQKNISNINASSNGIVWLLVLFVIVVFMFRAGKAIDPLDKGNTFDSRFFPVQAVEWLNAHPQQGYMFNEFDWGGYLLLKLNPRQQIFMDGHTHIYGEALTREYETVITLGTDWQKILGKYKIEWAIVRIDSPISQHLSSIGWNTIYKDDTAIILRNNQ